MMSQSKAKGHQAELRQAFRLFDSDDDGFITFEDLKRVMRVTGENLSDRELKDMFTKADINRDNLVDMKGKNCSLDHAYIFNSSQKIEVSVRATYFRRLLPTSLRHYDNRFLMYIEIQPTYNCLAQPENIVRF